jgi:DNA-binding MarR family transcriptional regulator
MATLAQQIRELESEADVIRSLRADAKTDTGRLTPFGKDLLHACMNNKIPNGQIASLLGITASAVSQNIKKLNNT